MSIHNANVMPIVSNVLPGTSNIHPVSVTPSSVNGIVSPTVLSSITTNTITGHNSSDQISTSISSVRQTSVCGIASSGISAIVDSPCSNNTSTVSLNSLVDQVAQPVINSSNSLVGDPIAAIDNVVQGNVLTTTSIAGSIASLEDEATDQDSALDLSDNSIRRSSVISGQQPTPNATTSPSSTSTTAPPSSDLVKQSLEDMINLQRSLIKEQSDKMASLGNIINQQKMDRQRQQIKLEEQQQEIQRQKIDQMLQSRTIEKQNYDRFVQESLLLEKDCKIAQQKKEKLHQQATIEQQNYDKLVQQHLLVETERQIAQHSNEQESGVLNEIFTPTTTDTNVSANSIVLDEQQLSIQCSSGTPEYTPSETPPTSSLTSSQPCPPSHQTSITPSSVVIQPISNNQSNIQPQQHPHQQQQQQHHIQQQLQQQQQQQQQQHQQQHQQLPSTPLSPTLTTTETTNPKCKSLMCDSLNELHNLISETSTKESHKVRI